MHVKPQPILPTRMTCNRTADLAVRSKLAKLNEAYNVFHAPILTYIAFELLL